MPRAKKLTTQAIDELLWLAHRASRARSRAGRSKFADQTESLERSLALKMRPYVFQLLRLADRALRGKA